ncbi:MAG: hypothetical protein JWP01_1119 [Myxococcales bacterium]|nr:hypothetical protein [Myxococcales bacterium]
MVHERVPTGTAMFRRDLDGVILRWNSPASFDPTSGKLTWSTITPSGVPNVATPSFVTAVAQYGRGNMNVTWRLIAPPSRIVPTGNTFTIVFPDVPGMRIFEPMTGDAPFPIQGLDTFHVDQGVAREVIEMFEPSITDVDFFGIPGLTHITISNGG